MPRILRLINRFNLGGPIYNATLLSRFLPPEFETLFAGGPPEEGEAHSGFIPDEYGLPWRELQLMHRAVNPLNDLRAFREIRRIIREFRPDIVHTHAAKAGALGRMAASIEKVPVIVHTYHGHVFDNYFSSFKSSLVVQTERYLARRSSAIITISPSQMHDIVVRHRIAPPKKVVTIPLGFDLDRFRTDRNAKRQTFRSQIRAEPTEWVFGLIARFVPVKNHMLFLNAFSLAKKQQPNIRAVCVGDGPLRVQAEDYARSLGLNAGRPGEHADVVFTSWVNDITEVIHGMDTVVISSHNEGTPVSLIEAQASGIPVISTDVGGVRDSMIGDHTGLLVPPDHPELFAQAMIQMVTQTELPKEFAATAEEFAHHTFSYHRLVSETAALYQQLLS